VLFQIRPGLTSSFFFYKYSANLVVEQVTFFSSNFYESPFFLSQLQNRANHLPQLFKPCILAPWSGFECGFVTMNSGFATMTVVLSFSF